MRDEPKRPEGQFLNLDGTALKLAQDAARRSIDVLPSNGLDALTNRLHDMAEQEEQKRQEHLAAVRDARKSYKERMSLQTFTKLLKALGALAFSAIVFLLVFLMQKHGVIEGGSVNWGRLKGEIKEIAGEDGAAVESIVSQTSSSDVAKAKPASNGASCSTHAGDTAQPSKKTQTFVFKQLPPLEAYAYADCLLARGQLRLPAPLLNAAYKEAKAKKLEGVATAFLTLGLVLDKNAGALNIEAKTLIKRCAPNAAPSATGCALSAFAASFSEGLASKSLLAFDETSKAAKDVKALTARFSTLPPFIGNLYAYAVFNLVLAGENLPKFARYDAVARRWLMNHTMCSKQKDCIPALTLRSLFLRDAVRAAFARRSFSDVKKLIDTLKRDDLGARLRTEISLLGALSAKDVRREEVRKIIVEADRMSLFKDDEELKGIVAPSLKALKISIKSN